MAINSATSAGTHDAKIIGLFGESLWDYPVNHYVDPWVAPSNSNALAPRLYYNTTFQAHFDRIDIAIKTYEGAPSPYFQQPYVVVEKPRKKRLYLAPGDTLVEFEVSPYEQSGTLSYTWYVDDVEQDGSAETFSHTFSY